MLEDVLEKILTKEVVSPIIIIIVSIFIYFIIKQIVVKMFKASRKFGIHKKSITIMNLVINIIKYIVIIVAFLSILGVWGIDTKALLASLGIAGVVAGLAMQDILKDFLAGFSIIFDNEYDVGDNIQIGDFRGDVVELGMKNTKIKAYTGEILTVANRNINEVINYSTPYTKCLVDISVSYNADLEKVEKVLNEVCKELSEKISYLKSDMEVLGVYKLDDSAILYRVAADCKPTMDKFLKMEINKAVKIAFDKNKIEIPFPQVVVHSE